MWKCKECSLELASRVTTSTLRGSASCGALSSTSMKIHAHSSRNIWSLLLRMQRGTSDTTMRIYRIRRDRVEEPVDVQVVIKGIKVLSNTGSVILGFIMLFGLIYALDLSFPDNLKYTFEFFQKIVMDLDGHKLNTKIQQLKIKLFA